MTCIAGVVDGNEVLIGGDSAGVLSESYLVISSPFSSFGLRNLPNTPGTYDCGYSLGSLNPRNIELGYAAGQGYSSVGTRGVSGFSCSITITSVGSTSGSNYSGALAGNFKGAHAVERDVGGRAKLKVWHSAPLSAISGDTVGQRDRQRHLRGVRDPPERRRDAAGMAGHERRQVVCRGRLVADRAVDQTTPEIRLVQAAAERHGAR